jgi:hypothetical protein
MFYLLTIVNAITMLVNKKVSNSRFFAEELTSKKRPGAPQLVVSPGRLLSISSDLPDQE